MRRLRTSLTVVSLVCSLLLCGLWVRSYWWFDNAGFNWEERTPRADGHTGTGNLWSVVSGGELALMFQRGVKIQGNIKPPPYTHVAIPRARPLRDWFGSYAPEAFPSAFTVWKVGSFGFVHVASPGRTIVGLLVRIWFPALLFAIPPARWSWRRRKQQAGAGFAIEVAPASKEEDSDVTPG